MVAIVKRMHQKLNNQLVRKFQFKLYSDIANFERDIHSVDLGNSYLSQTSCHEMLTYLSKFII